MDKLNELVLKLTTLSYRCKKQGSFLYVRGKGQNIFFSLSDIENGELDVIVSKVVRIITPFDSSLEVVSEPIMDSGKDATKKPIGKRTLFLAAINENGYKAYVKGDDICIEKDGVVLSKIGNIFVDNIEDVNSYCVNLLDDLDKKHAKK